MRLGLPSGTSFLVALARGIGVDDRVRDPHASKLLPNVLRRLAEGPKHSQAASSLWRASIRAATLGLVDHIALRTEAIDLHLAEALRSGIRQLVILGAGLDMRAWRISSPSEVLVFELDHPSTQKYKRERVGALTPRRDIAYLAVDFERERFCDLLLDSGFDPTEPSAWVWEGVAMYLPDSAVRKSLEQITEVSKAGSCMMMTYRVPGALPLGAIGRIAVPALFSAAGEALKATMRPEEVVSMLTPGWQVSYDDNAQGWKAITGSEATAVSSFLSERLVVAVRGG